jgi:uncharacterized protein
MKYLVLRSISLYKSFASPVFQTLFGSACVYKISCSEYATLAVKKHGTFKGLAYSVKRICSCNSLFRSEAFETI